MKSITERSARSICRTMVLDSRMVAQTHRESDGTVRLTIRLSPEMPSYFSLTQESTRDLRDLITLALGDDAKEEGNNG